MPRAAHAGDWIALLGLATLWGSAFMFNELALRSFSPASLVYARIVIAALVLVIFLGQSSVALPHRGSGVFGLFVMAVFGTVLPFNLVAWAQQHIDSGLTGILMAIVPLFILALAHFFLPGERLTLSRATAFIFGFVGVICIIGPQSLTVDMDNMQMWGMLAVLGAAFSYALNAIYVRRRQPGDPMSVAAGVMMLAAILSIPGAVLDSPRADASPELIAVISLAVLGLLCTGFASVLYFRIVQGPGPAFMSQVSYLIPVVAVLVGVVFLGETLNPRAIGGMVLIVSGIALSELGPRIQRSIIRPALGRLTVATAVEKS